MSLEKLPNVIEHFTYKSDNRNYIIAVEHEGDNIVNGITVTDINELEGRFYLYGTTLSIIFDVLEQGFHLPDLKEPNLTPVA